jgi:ATP-dependent DNA ligase
MGLEGIVSKRAQSPYRSGPSKAWLKTKNVVESELILLGTDHDNEGKPIAYLGREEGSELRFAGTAFLTLAGDARTELQKRIERFPIRWTTWVVLSLRNRVLIKVEGSYGEGKADHHPGC